MSVVVAHFLFQLLAISFCSGSTHGGCIQSEREALLSFKNDLEDPSNRLASWTGDGDCCKWAGIVCDNSTGHVLELSLRNPYDNLAEKKPNVRSRLVGKINPSLLQFKYLSYLDLSFNDFEAIQVPTFFGLMGSLRYLNLSGNGFVGTIPHQLGNLHNLLFLDLSQNYLDNFEGIQNLTSLKFLDLSSNQFNSVIPKWLYMFRPLEYLSLAFNRLQGTIPDGLGNLTSLRELHLSNNINLEGKIPRSFGGLCNLRSLTISHVKLNQEISVVLDIFSMCISNVLVSLDLSNSRFSGHLTDQLGLFKNLETLVLSYNSILGPIPSSLGQLVFLRLLDLSFNKLNGTLTQIHFLNLARLSSFEVSGNSLTLSVSPDWIPPFQLDTLRLGSCHWGTQFPEWLYTQTRLTYLDLSKSGISDSISDRLWEFLFEIDSINLSQNQIYGEIPNLTKAVQLKLLDLSSNNFSGRLPLISLNLFELDLSYNSLSGSINHFLCHEKNESKSLQILNIGGNFLSGELPDCWMNLPYLSVLNLGHNKFTGNIPNSIGTLSYLQSVKLCLNNFSGRIPVSLQNLTALVVLDLAENQLIGNIPTWIAEKSSRITILNLRSNKFLGHFPIAFCRLTSLQVLDLAHNNLSGHIPRCISNFSAMVTLNYSTPNYITYPSDSPGKFIEDALLVLKGRSVEYKTTLNLLRSIDLSGNNFSGTIPMEVTNLKALQSLNLSHNGFTGRIPERIGGMRLVESVDFSLNQFSGEIPQSISNLTFLSNLNLSNNKLVGKIPSSTQLQGFDASCFTGNELCGSPLPNNCFVPEPNDEKVPGGNDDDNYDGDDDEVNWFYVSMALGFVMGLWILIGPLLVNRRWRYMYCHFLDLLVDKCRVVVRKCCYCEY